MLKTLAAITIAFLLVGQTSGVLAQTKTGNQVTGPTADTVVKGLDDAARQAGLSTAKTTPQAYVLPIVKTVLGLLGLIFVVMVISAGVRWLTARGNDDVITSAKQTLINSTAGLAIVLLSLSILQFLGSTIEQAITTSPRPIIEEAAGPPTPAGLITTPGQPPKCYEDPCNNGSLSFQEKSVLCVPANIIEGLAGQCEGCDLCKDITGEIQTRCEDPACDPNKVSAQNLKQSCTPVIGYCRGCPQCP